MTNSRSPTLRPSRDDGTQIDPEKLPESMQGDRSVQRDEKRRGSTWKDQSQNDPFGDEADGDVKYRTLKWWYVLSLVGIVLCVGRLCD